MYFFETIFRKSLPIFLVSCVTNNIFGEPFLTPDDPVIRHEIRYLSDEGGLDGLQNTWSTTSVALTQRE